MGKLGKASTIQTLLWETSARESARKRPSITFGRVCRIYACWVRTLVTYIAGRPAPRTRTTWDATDGAYGYLAKHDNLPGRLHPPPFEGIENRYASQDYHCTGERIP